MNRTFDFWRLEGEKLPLQWAKMGTQTTPNASPQRERGQLVGFQNAQKSGSAQDSVAGGSSSSSGMQMKSSSSSSSSGGRARPQKEFGARAVSQMHLPAGRRVMHGNNAFVPAADAGDDEDGYRNNDVLEGILRSKKRENEQLIAVAREHSRRAESQRRGASVAGGSLAGTIPPTSAMRGREQALGSAGKEKTGKTSKTPEDWPLWGGKKYYRGVNCGETGLSHARI
jgi:hypothetical protein